MVEKSTTLCQEKSSIDACRHLFPGNECECMADRQTGIVKWFNIEKCYGFISADDASGDVFVHHTGIHQTGFRRLEEGQHVHYVTAESDRGPIAQKVTPTS